MNRRSFLKATGGVILASSTIGLPLRAQDLPSLTISLPAQIESFPIAFAADAEQNIFRDHGLNVELVAFSNLAIRNVSLFTGELDGVMSDISSLLSLIDNGTAIEITSTAYENNDDNRRLTLSTEFFSEITDLDQLLTQVKTNNEDAIGLVRRTDMEYATDLLVESRDFALNEDEIYTEVDDITDLSTFVLTGATLGGVLPEPIGSYLQFITDASGTPIVILSEYQGIAIPPTVLAYQSELIEEQPEIIEALYDGYRAVLAELRTADRELIINIGIDAALAFFFPGLTRANLPPGGEAFLAQYLVPDFPDPRALLTSEYDPVASWGVNKGFLSEKLAFEAVFNGIFAPDQP